MPKAKVPVPQAVKMPIKLSVHFVLQHWLKFLIGLIITIPVLGIAFFLLKPETQEVVTDVAKKGTLLQTVEAVGEVISEKDLNLKFPVTGVVDEVLVTEGDVVIAGQVLATLRSGSITQADVSSAAASLQSTQADLAELVEGTRPEEIIIAEAEVENRKAQLGLARTVLENAEDSLEKSFDKLEKLNREADANLSGNIGSADSVVIQKLSVVQTSLNVLDDIFSTSIVEDAVEFQQSIPLAEFRNKQNTARKEVSRVLRDSPSDDYNDARDHLSDARSAALLGSIAVESAYVVIVNTDLTNYFTTATKETYKDRIGDERSLIDSALASISDELGSLRDATASFDTKIASEEAAVTTSQGTRDKALSDISTYETLLITQEAQLSLKRAGARKTDIDSARAKVNQAYAELQRARSRLEDTVLRAPIDGRITKADLKTGEFTGDLENFERAITMLGDSPYRVEIYISEIDIPKVVYAQTGAIELDAYPGRDFWLSVTEIDPAATDIDGVPKYRIKLDFVADVEDLLKIGMTGDVDIITDVRFGAVHIPGRAVIKDEEGYDIVRVQKKNGDIDDVQVEVGMETDTDVEILRGIKEGDVVVILIKN